MKITMRDMAVGSFAPMLESLSQVLDKGAAHGEAAGLDLPNARLAPDMYTLAQQVQLACHHARDCISRLSGRGAVKLEDAASGFSGFKTQIVSAVDFVREAPAAAFEGAETRDCSIEIPGNRIIQLDGLQLLRAWSLPHFYFHVVTAYDILRNNGVQLGKPDYLSQIGPYVRPKP